MTRSKLNLIAVVAGVIVLAAIVVLALILAARPVFQGQRSIDLGMKEIHGEPAVFTGEFTLHNTLDEAVHVLGLRPSCGCVQVQLTRSVIPKGEDLVIPFTMTLERHGVKEVFIELVLPEHVERLELRAEARENYHITLTPTMLRLSDAGPHEIVAYVEVFDGQSPPPMPTIEAPTGVETAFDGWTKLDARHIDGTTSPRWRGAISVALAADAIPADIDFSDAALSFAIGAKDRQTVRLVAPQPVSP